MSGENARVKSCWLQIEDPAQYGVIPDATGAASLFVPAELAEADFMKNEAQVIERNFATGRNKRTPHRTGKQKGSFSIKPHAHGYAATGVLEDAAPPTAIWIDAILNSIMGDPQLHDATLITAGTTTASLHTAGNELAIGDLVAVRGPVTNGGFAQWGRISANASPYAISPVLAAAPVALDVVSAGRTYYPKVGPNSTHLIGPHLTLIVDEDNIHYALPGARPKSITLKGIAGEKCEWAINFDGDRRVRQQFGALPNAPTDDPEPMILRMSPIVINGVTYDVMSAELDLQLTTVEVRATRGTNSRAGWRVIGVHPVLKIDPLNDTALEDLYNTEAIFEVLAQFGDGSPVNGGWNTMAVHFEGAQIQEAPNEVSDGGIMRKPVIISPKDRGATGAGAYYFQIGIC